MSRGSRSNKKEAEALLLDSALPESSNTANGKIPAELRTRFNIGAVAISEDFKETPLGNENFGDMSSSSSDAVMETEDNAADLPSVSWQTSRRSAVRKISETALAVNEAGVVECQIVQKPDESSDNHETAEDATSSPRFVSWASEDTGGPDHESHRQTTRRSQSLLQAGSFTGRTASESSDPSDHLSFHHETLMASKHLHTNQLMSLHSLKTKLSKYQSYVERAFTLINIGTEETIIEGFAIIAKVMTKAWAMPKIGHDLAYGLCDYLTETGTLKKILDCFVHKDTPGNVRLAAGQALEECCSARNRDYMVKCGFLKPVICVAKSFATQSAAVDETVILERVRISISLMESMFKHSAETSLTLIDVSALDHLLSTIKSSKCSQILRHCALAMANLSMYSDTECHQKMTGKKVPDWLFLLASLQDDITRYYACLAICMLVSNKEIETAVIKSGTLSLVEPFLLAHKPEEFAMADYKHSQGRPQEWLQKLVPMLGASRCEARSLAAFHFAMEAGIKKEQDKLEVFQAISATEALKLVASRPDDVGPRFARMALKIIGEEVPYKLSQQVPLWSVDDVEYWVKHIGFESYAKKFKEQMVDGDILLLLSQSEMEKDIGMESGLLRRRFIRELDSLKIAADYGCVDESHLDQFLMSLNPYFSVYTYQMLELGLEVCTLHATSEEILTKECKIVNPVHRMKLIQAFQDLTHIQDMEIAILSRHIDIFISYRRSNGSQLASLIKVLLQLRGHKVFIDVDRLYAGKFDASLLKNIQAAKHFVLVLTPHALDKCQDDEGCEDWVHKEVHCALENGRNVIPIFDPAFEWPDENRIPSDIRAITRFNGVRWVHEYQEACVDKLEKFITGEVNKSTATAPHISPAPPSGFFTGKNGPMWKTRNATSIMPRRKVSLRQPMRSNDYSINSEYQEEEETKSAETEYTESLR